MNNLTIVADPETNLVLDQNDLKNDKLELRLLDGLSYFKIRQTDSFTEVNFKTCETGGEKINIIWYHKDTKANIVIDSSKVSIEFSEYTYTKLNIESRSDMQRELQDVENIILFLNPVNAQAICFIKTAYDSGIKTFPRKTKKVLKRDKDSYKAFKKPKKVNRYKKAA
jgi:hypothetical protein